MKHGEERRRKEEGMGALPWMPLLDHVKYANCDYVKTVRGSVNPTTMVLVPPSTNHISFDRAYSLRAMGTHRIPRVYSRCPKSVHTARHTRAPTLVYALLSLVYNVEPYILDTAFSSFDTFFLFFTCCDFMALTRRYSLGFFAYVQWDDTTEVSYRCYIPRKLFPWISAVKTFE